MTTFIDVRRSDSRYSWIKEKMNDTIREHHSFGNIRKYKILRIQEVNNIHHYRAYKSRKEEIELENDDHAHERWLFHGTSRVRSITENGFDLDRAKSGGMFGAGIYFTKYSSKANQYVFKGSHSGVCRRHGERLCPDCERKLLLCHVCLGRTKEKYSPSVDRIDAPRGYHSIKGMVGDHLKYSEYVVYDSDQVNVRYVITYKVVPEEDSSDDSDW